MASSFNYNNSENYNSYHFEKYDGKIVLKSQNEETQKIFDKILEVFDKNNNKKLDAKEIKSIWDNFVSADQNDDKIVTEEEIANCISNNNLLSKLNITPKDLIKFIKIINATIDKSFAKTKASVEKRLLESFKQKYPSDKYKIEIVRTNENSSEINIREIKSNNIESTYIINENGDYIIKKDKNCYIYNNDGTCASYAKFDEKKQCYVHGDPISDMLNKDVTAKTSIGFWTTGKDIEKHIKLINSKNIMSVLENYFENYGENLLDAIDKEWGLDDKIKERLKEHLNKCIIESEYWKSNKPNTKIDKDFSQGIIGDCWLIGTITSVASKPSGLKILNNMIKENPDGTYSVKFKGADKTYIVTPLELACKSDYAIGDLDARIIEIAAEKHYKLFGIKMGGNPAFALDLFLGTNDKWKNLLSIYNPINDSTEKLQQVIKDPNTIITASVSVLTRIGLSEKEEYYNEIAFQHAYAVIDIDDKYVYLKNTGVVEGKQGDNQNKKDFKMPIKDFKKYLSNIQYAKITP